MGPLRLFNLLKDMPGGFRLFLAVMRVRWHSRGLTSDLLWWWLGGPGQADWIPNAARRWAFSHWQALQDQQLQEWNEVWDLRWLLPSAPEGSLAVAGDQRSPSQASPSPSRSR